MTSTTFAPQATRLELIGRPDDPVPQWVAVWCGRSGSGLVRRPTPVGSAFESGPGADAWSRIAEDVAAATAAGVAVIVCRPAWCTAGTGRVVAAVGSLPDDTSVVEDATECAAAMAATIELVHGVPVSFAERSVGLDGAVSHGLAVLHSATAVAAGRRPAVRVTTRLLRAHPHELVNEELDADLLVVGGTRAGPRGPALGLVALSALQHAPCPVLLVPRTPSTATR